MALSAVYQCEPYELFTMNPLVDGQVVDLLRYVRGLPEDQAKKALVILKTALSS